MNADILYSLLIIAGLVSVSAIACRRGALVPGRMQNAAELLFGGIDDFICGILGPKGRRYTPFIGTLFIYILCMNLAGLVPFMKSPTSNWSTTLALALCVFAYVQYSAVRELGFLGYLDHLFGRPRGIVAFSVFIPILMFFIHIVSELIRPISLSLRLRSNIWGEDMLIGVLSGFGIKAVPLIVFSMGIIIIGAVVQAVVFSLLTTIYFALVLTHEE
ncbi:MAG TPA: F0F1 ATP synthase subunit A [Candidatus Margulisiibacteriota bacterium]|nr:F0F1 ATP synthase subunit A [Candidatus Margulisiibacteriota bacterium]